MRRRFKDTALELAAVDERLVVLLGDVSVYLFKDFAERHPDRFYNLGICENTIISVAAGLASQGFLPLAHTIAPFISERCLEQIKLDMCYNEFGGNILSCGASFDYAWDGGTHHCYSDLAILRAVPGMEVVQPGSDRELDALLRSQYDSGRTTYYRLSDNPHQVKLDAEFGQGIRIKDVGAPLTVMTAGPILDNVLAACADLPVNLVYFHTIKPIDRVLINAFRNTRILVVHDAFGLQEAIAEVPELCVSYHGLPDRFCGWYGTVHDIRKKLGLDPAGIRAAIQAKLFELPPRGVWRPAAHPSSAGHLSA